MMSVQSRESRWEAIIVSMAGAPRAYDSDISAIMMIKDSPRWPDAGDTENLTLSRPFAGWQRQGLRPRLTRRRAGVGCGRTVHA